MIVEPILVPVKVATYRLGYTPTNDYVKMKKRND